VLPLKGGTTFERISFMKRFTIAMMVGAILALAAFPASAAPRDRPLNPVRYCQAALGEQTSPVTGVTFDAYLVPVRFTFGGESFVDPEFALSSFQACVSTVAGGFVDGAIPADRISTPAYLAQCDLLEQAGFISYPYVFYGMYPAENRADCVRILKGVHSGQLELPAPPPNAE
jgi:hypothetical protein